MGNKRLELSGHRSATICAAAVLGFLGVALGAFGAHALKDMLVANERLATWETAVFYHLVHAVAILATYGLPIAWRRLIGFCWIVGVIIFSGSLYVLCLTGIGWLGAITPLGGLALLAGWLVLGWAAFRRHL